MARVLLPSTDRSFALLIVAKRLSGSIPPPAQVIHFN
jgi:hypothetical protein